jgi:hypothetical protein
MANEFIARNGLIAQNNSTVSGSLTVTAGITGSIFGSASYATTAATASYANNFTVAGTLTAQTLVVQTITSSTVYSSGSNIFGNSLANTQTFTGSMYQTGSVAAFMGSVGIGTTAPTTKLEVFSIETTGARTSPYDVLTVTAESPSLPYDGFGGGIVFENRAYTAGVVNSARIRSVINNNSVNNFGGSIAFDITATTGSAFTQAMLIHYNGRVGIGTTAPSAKLHVSGGDAILNNAFIGEVPTYGAANAQFSHIDRDGAGEYSFLSANDGTTYVNSKTGANIYFRVNNSNMVTITPSGSVGIGTTNPAQKLEVNGGDALIRTAYIGNISAFGTNYASFSHLARTGSGDYSFLSGNAGETYINAKSGSPIYFRVNNLDKVVITSAGSVGIGTANPSNTLQVVGGVTATSFTGSFSGSLTAPGSTTQILYNNAGTIAGDSGLIYSGSRVGIGTTSPSAKLEILGNDDQIILNTAGTYSSIYFRNNGTSVGQLFSTNAATYLTTIGSRILYLGGGNGVTQITLDGTNVGIGTGNPGALLDVNGNAYFRNIIYSDTLTAYSGGSLTLNYGAAGNLNVNGGPGGATRMRITPSGSFLVGDTVAPSENNWKGTAVFGVSGSDKVITGYLTSTSTGAYVGGHNSALSAWADLNIAGTNLIFRSSQTEYMRLNSSGNVGISTTSPLAILSVGAGSLADTNVPIQISSEGTGTQKWIGINKNGNYGLILGYTENGGLGGNGAYIRQVASDPMFFVVNSTTVAMTMLSSGNVGIGTTNPTGKLTIAPYATSNSSSIEFTNADNAVISSYYSQTFAVDNTNTQSGRQFTFAKGGKGYGTQTKTMMVIDADSSYVGIGTTSPSNLLNTFIANGAGAFSKGVRISTGDGSFTAGHGGMLEFQNEDVMTAGIRGIRQSGWGSSLAFYVHNTTAGNTFDSTFVERMRIAEDGNVGIGTTNPTGQMSGTFGIGMYHATLPAIGFKNNTTSWLWYGDGSTLKMWNVSAGDILTATTSGTVGIGTTNPGAKFQVSAGRSHFFSGDNYSVGLAQTAAQGNYMFLGTAADGTFYISETGGTARVTVQQGGSVGIGTTSPGAKLQIAGTTGTLLTVGTLTNNWAGNVAIGIENGNGVILSKINAANDTNRVLVIARNDTEGATIYGYTPTGGSTDIGFLIKANSTSYFNGGNVGIGSSSPTQGKLVVNGGVYATSFTGSLSGTATTASYVLQAVSASHATYAATAGSSTTAATSSYANNFTVAGTLTAQTLIVQTITSSIIYSSGSNKFGNSLANTQVFTGSLYQTGSVAAFMGSVGIGTTNPGSKLYVEGGSANWSLPTPGTAVGTIHLDPGADTDNFGNAITFGASDSSAGSTAMAGIYVRTDGAYGSKMYFGTTDSYVAGSKIAVTIDESQRVGIGSTSPTQGKLVVNGGVYATSFTGSLSGNATTATTATNVVGGANRVLFNNATDTTTTDANLTWNGATFNIGGTLTATVKSFIIDHPTKADKKLQYGVLEGPEHSVYVRGKLKNTNYIPLPDYWHALVHEDSITVNITAIGRNQEIWVNEVTDRGIYLGYEGNAIEYFYTVFAERKDIDKLFTEFDKE